MNFKPCLYLALLCLTSLSACEETPIYDEKSATYVPQPQQTDVCQAFQDTPKAEMKTFWLGLKPLGTAQNFDYKFSIPEGYFNQRGGAKLAETTGKSDGAILLYARYPDFAPYSRQFSKADIFNQSRDPSRPAIEYIGYEISMLWGGWAPPGTLPTDWLKPGRERALNLRFKRKDTSPEGWQIEERPSSPFPDLFELDPDMKYGRSAIDKDHRFFIHRNVEGAGTDQIICKRENFGFRDCSHSFVYKQIVMQLDYESAYLNDWKEIKQNTQKFFDCAIIEKGITIGPEDR